MVRKIILSISLSFIIIFLNAQNLDQLPTKERNSVLIAKTKEVIMKHGPGYWREHKKPVIETKYISKNGFPEKGENIGRKYYNVKILYDKTVETLYDINCAAEVWIWADTGQILLIAFGNGYGWIIDNDPATRSTEQEDKRIVHFQSLEDWRKNNREFKVENEPVAN
ncbi:hypothetical protein [Bacteroides sp. 224]|uniref:hypothetical protein n=1 Tax=Bacteroides sp. 224 TaxID=2302936 RepID=UPI0013D7C581|nr:hypothetical protein [Bacteroides sp. 224]NDV64576.1 hypothetical protein [Bacteroides sp. 224]